MHIVILLISTAFTFNKLGHCPMALQYYTLKLEFKEISQHNFKQNSQWGKWLFIKSKASEWLGYIYNRNCCLNGRKCCGLHCIQDTSAIYMPRFQRLLHGNAAEFAQKSMSDNIRKKAIFEKKMQKLLKIYQNLTFCKFDSNVAKWECFYSHYKKIPVSLSFIVTEIWPGQNTNLKSVFFWPKLQKFWQNWILIFFVAQLQ